jgi:hypothetical protein
MYVELDKLAELLAGIPSDRKFFNTTSIASPLDIVLRERFLRELGSEIDLGPSVACDALLFGYEEQPRRELTIVGGAPYWLSNRPWPVGSDGEPMEFVAQFSFTDSTDLVPDLPGELLSVFVSQAGIETGELRVEWQFVEEGAELISPEDVPQVAQPLVATPAFAALCRIQEYPHARPKKDSLSFDFGHYVPRNYSTKIRDGADSWKYLPTVCGSKIGGAPWYFTESPPETTGRFLCALHSLRHPVDVPWPFLNVEDPLTPQMLGGIGCNGGRGCHDTVAFPQLGALYFYLQEDARVRVLFQSPQFEEYLNVM